MSLLDGLVVVAIVVVTGMWVLRVAVGWRYLALALLGLVVGQVVVEGFYWQMVPGYLLLGAVGLVRVWRGFVGLVLLGGLAACWMVAPVPRLTAPEGRYALGTRVYRWVDGARERRDVVAQVWYPAVVSGEGRGSLYLDGLGRLPEKVSFVPRFVMRHYDRIETGGNVDAAVARTQNRWPVVVFSPGYGAARAFYTSLVRGLASEGYVVVAVDHPYEAAIVEVADGRLVTTVEDFARYGGDRGAYMRARLEVRAADVRFVLDQLGRPEVMGRALWEQLDLEHVGVIGHSFGGATAGVVMERDARVKAAANLDGTLYGDLPEKALRGPWLLLESDPEVTHHSERYLAGNRQLLEKVVGPKYRVTMRGVNHYGFTDVPLLFTGLGRYGLAMVLGGGREVGETHRAVTAMVTAFLDGPMRGAPRDLEAVVNERGVTR